MQDEQSYDDLTTMFERQDEVLRSDGFVDDVMRPIHRRARWRAPLLFGAGGIGVGAAISQASNLLGMVSEWMPDKSFALTQATDLSAQTMPLNPLWFAAIGIVALSCFAIVLSERA